MINKTNSYQKGFSAVEITLGVAVLAIVGLLGYKFYDATNKPAAVSNVSQLKNTSLPATLPELADLAQIKESALTNKPGITVIHIELESTKDGELVYKAQLSDGTVVVYNARTGVKMNSTATSEKSDEALPASFSGGIGFAQAIVVARTVKPTGDIQKIELELEDGVVVYSVRFSDKARVDVNAETGEVVRSKSAKLEDKTEDTDHSQAPESAHSTDDSHDDQQVEDSPDEMDLSDSDDDDDVDSTDDSHDASSGSDGSGSSGNGRR